MFAKLFKLAGTSASLRIYAVVLSVGLVVGGWSVHKLHQASQTSRLKAELSRLERQADARVELAQAAADRAIARAKQTSATIKEVKVYVPSHPACHLGSDALRLLNLQRQ